MKRLEVFTSERSVAVRGQPSRDKTSGHEISDSDGLILPVVCSRVRARALAQHDLRSGDPDPENGGRARVRGGNYCASRRGAVPRGAGESRARSYSPRRIRPELGRPPTRLPRTPINGTARQTRRRPEPDADP